MFFEKQSMSVQNPYKTTRTIPTIEELCIAELIQEVVQAAKT